MTWCLALSIAAITACARPAATPAHLPMRASVTRSDNTLVVRVIPASGTKINALLPPLLELPSGRTSRLTGSRLTASSAYFVTPPEVVLPGDTPLAGARIRASICDSGAAVCRVVVIPLQAVPLLVPRSRSSSLRSRGASSPYPP